MITRISQFFLKSARFALVATFLPLLCGVCQAVPIVPGSVQFPAAAEPNPTLGSSLVFSTGAVGFSTATFSGTLTSSVWSNDATNPYGLDRMTFVYEIDNFAVSADEITRLSISDFDSFLTDASFAPDDSATAPTLITRSANGTVMGFNFVVPGLAPGSNSTLLVVQTNAATYQNTTASLIDGTVASVASLAPLTVVPEPASVVLFTLGGLGLLWIAKRRRTG
jgi:hypothetical protein